MAAGLLNSDHYYYDAEKYQEMAPHVAETVLGWNGFDRAQLGIRARVTGFLEELRGERQREILEEPAKLEREP